MIAPGRALRDVRANLREVVMPDLESDRARAILGSALGILDELAGRVQVDGSPARVTATEAIAALPGWERRLAAAAPAAAESVAGRRAAAEAALPDEPLRAREEALTAVEEVTAAAWDDIDGADRDALLAEVRKLTRADMERQKGKR